MKKGWIVGGLVLGTGLLYLLDPVSGRKRRALLREKLSRVFTLGQSTPRFPRKDPEAEGDYDGAQRSLPETSAGQPGAVERDGMEPDSETAGAGELRVTLGEIASEHARELGQPEPTELLQHPVSAESRQEETPRKAEPSREEGPELRPRRRRDRGPRPEI